MSACPTCERSSPRQRSDPSLGNRRSPRWRGRKLNFGLALHEIKLDGYRMAARIDNGRVQLLTRLVSTGLTNIQAPSQRSPI